MIPAEMTSVGLPCFIWFCPIHWPAVRNMEARQSFDQPQHPVVSIPRAGGDRAWREAMETKRLGGDVDRRESARFARNELTGDSPELAFSPHWRQRHPDLLRGLEHDPEKGCPGLDPGWTSVFGERSYSANQPERDHNSKRNHPALGSSMPANAVSRNLRS